MEWPNVGWLAARKFVRRGSSLAEHRCTEGLNKERLKQPVNRKENANGDQYHRSCRKNCVLVIQWPAIAANRQSNSAIADATPKTQSHMAKFHKDCKPQNSLRFPPK
ncbi:hypothetical protein HAX54_004483 [Datura stramonium]|uniref:Uncharacterized protein n=1 Tax=Datura stramonium TaxID=4076 RepID=A0ABS8T9E3_DATST|nr:hypothetical protein [Datura stramonium]